MSKRFGRQQKKKLKQQLEQQDNLLTRKEWRISELNGATRKAEEVLAVIRNINPHFPALEEVTQISKEMRCIALEKKSSYNPCCNEYPPTPDFDEAHTINYVNLHTLEADLAKCPIFGDSTMFSVNVGGGVLKLKLSNTAVHGMSDVQLSELLAREFLYAIRREKNGY